MLNKKLGKTGLELPAVGFGGMRFGDIENREECVETCQYAYDKGIRYYDTAPGYFGGKSEEVFGEALHDKKDVILSTKSSVIAADKLRNNLETSLKRFRRDKISVFHLWCIMSIESFQKRIRSGAIDEAMKMKEEGLFDHLFMSTHMDGKNIVKVVNEYDYLEGLTLGFNAMNFPYRSDAVQFARDRGMAVVTMNPLNGGLIPNNAERLGFIKREADRSVVEGAIRFNLSTPGISVALVGMGNKKDVDEAVTSANPFMPWSESEIKNLEENLDAAFEGICTGCRYCDKCQHGLNPYKYMMGYNQKILGKGDDGVKGALKWDYGLMPEVWDACEECGDCEELCTQHLPIIERMKEIGKLK